VANKDPAQYLPTGIQKSYFMLSRSARAVLDTALREYRPGGPESILVGGIGQLKPALRLMTDYRLVSNSVRASSLISEGFILSEIRFSPFGLVSFHRIKE
jgi:hypothetical protein